MYNLNKKLENCCSRFFFGLLPGPFQLVRTRTSFDLSWKSMRWSWRPRRLFRTCWNHCHRTAAFGVAKAGIPSQVAFYILITAFPWIFAWIVFKQVFGENFVLFSSPFLQPKWGRKLQHLQRRQGEQRLRRSRRPAGVGTRLGDARRSLWACAAWPTFFASSSRIGM